MQKQTGKLRALFLPVVRVGAMFPTAYAAASLSMERGQPSEAQLKSMSLAQPGNVEVTTVPKQAEEVWHTAAAVLVLTHEDILRSGAKTIPDLLRVVPGVQVSQEQSDQGAVGIGGLDSPFSKGLLVLIDGRRRGRRWKSRGNPAQRLRSIALVPLRVSVG
jgi:iron complex outermembrane receptor protein